MYLMLLLCSIISTYDIISMFSTSFFHFSGCSNISPIDFHGTKAKIYMNSFKKTSYMFLNFAEEVSIKIKW